MVKGLQVFGVSLATILGVGVLVTLSLFIMYIVEWENKDVSDTNARDNLRTKADLLYYGTVLILLLLLTGMHSFVLIKELL